MELSTTLLGLFTPSLSEEIASKNYPSTPPAQLLSPQPRTPRPTRFLEPPRTPLAKLPTDFPAVISLSKEVNSHAEVGSITRPGSTCSNYSSSSDSSFNSLTTFTTAGGSCTSPETESYFFPDEPRLKEDRSTNPGEAGTSSNRTQHETSGIERESGIQARVRKVQWSKAMDGHLWKAYITCQQDPKITPFFVLPGQVPPLGVCHKVAREAKRSWKEAKAGDAWRSPSNTTRPSQKRFVTPAKGGVVGGNRGDVLRKTSPYCWPASEASTRRRLRELCRQNYGPSHNPHHGYHQQRRPASSASILRSRSSTVSPSPYQSAASYRVNSCDAFLFSTRSIALSLTTSTASTMNPDSVLAAIAAGYDIDTTVSVNLGGPDLNFVLSPGSSLLDSAAESNNHDVLGAGSFENEVSRLKSKDIRFIMERESTPIAGVHGSSNTVPSVSTHSSIRCPTPALLPPLELKSSSSAYGTWPRRQKRQEEPESGDGSIVLPPPRRARRGTIGDLFGEPVPAPPAPRTRTRGFTIGSTSGNSISRRRYRPLAPLLTVTGPVSYDSPNDTESLSPLASRESTLGHFRDLLETPKRLGSPFMEQTDWTEKSAEFDGFLSGTGIDESLGRRCKNLTKRIVSVRPVKRIRE